MNTHTQYKHYNIAQRGHCMTYCDVDYYYGIMLAYVRESL